MPVGFAIVFIALFTIVGLLAAGLFVAFRIRRLSEDTFGTPSLFDGLKRQEEIWEEEARDTDIRNEETCGEEADDGSVSDVKEKKDGYSITQRNKT